MSNDYVMTAPTKEKREAGCCRSYMLISYSHANGPLVDKLLNDLYEKGANFWYDTEMNVGDNWKREVENSLSVDEGCGGMVFLVSVEYLTSGSCGWEMEQFLKKRAENKRFPSFVILIDHNNVEDLGNKAAERTTQLSTIQTLSENVKRLNDILNNQENLYLTLNERNVLNVSEKLYNEVFKENGCTVKVNDSLSNYARSKKLEQDNENRNGETIIHYSIPFGKIVNEKKYGDSWKCVQAPNAVWTVFDLKDDKLYLCLKTNRLQVSPMGTCGRILAKSKLQDLINRDAVNDEKSFLLWQNKEGTYRRYLEFSEEEMKRFVDIRFMFKNERENENLKNDINWALAGNYDSEANGYYFVMENGENGKKLFYYADRFSTAVYENVWRDEIASVIPVVEIKAPEA